MSATESAHGTGNGISGRTAPTLTETGAILAIFAILLAVTPGPNVPVAVQGIGLIAALSVLFDVLGQLFDLLTEIAREVRAT